MASILSTRRGEIPNDLIVRYDLIFYALCIVFLVLHLFVPPFVPIFYEADHINLLNDAKRFAEGEFPYRDFFEFQFPGSILFFGSLISVFGPKYWILNVAIVGHGMAAAYLGVKITRAIVPSVALSYLPSAIYLFFGFRWFGIDGEHRMFSPLFVYAALLAILHVRSNGRVAAAGVLCSAATFFTQQRGLLALATIVLFIFIEYGSVKREWKPAIKLSLIASISFVASLAVMLAPFVIVAGPTTFFECTISFLKTYAQDPTFNSFNSYFLTFSKLSSAGTTLAIATIFYSLLIPFVYCGALIYAFLVARRGEFQRVSGVILISLVGLAQAVSSTGPNVYRLYQVAIPALVILAWIGWRTGQLNQVRAKFLTAALAIFGILLGVRIQTTWELKPLETFSGRIVFPSSVTSERYTWLKEHTDPGDYVYETYNSHVNFPLGLRNPSRISILLNSPYSPPKHIAWVIEDLKSKKARYILWDGAWTAEMGVQAEDELLKPFYSFLIQNYHRVATFTPYEGRNREMWEINETPIER